LRASSLAAGRKLTNWPPLFLFDSRGAERVPEEIERRVLVRAAPVVVLAVHDAGLLLIELEAALRQP
jgi:hypothetical protein